MADQEQKRQETAGRAARGVLAEREGERERREREAFARAIQAALSYGVEPRGEK